LTTGSPFNNYALSIQTIGSGANIQYRLVNWTLISADATIQARLLSNISFPFSTMGNDVDFNDGVGVTQTRFTVANAYGGVIWGISLTTGQLLWNITTSEAPFNPSTGLADYGKYACAMENGHWTCWDIFSGNQLWSTSTLDNGGYPWGEFWAYGAESAYGLLYAQGYDGLYAFNWTNGVLVWHDKFPAPPFETPYGEYTFQSTGKVSDGILYEYNTEHTPSEPITRGWRLLAVNTTTGANIWNITGEMVPGGTADGYLAASNIYDGYMYIFGQGTSATTIQSNPAVTIQGSTVEIQGTVLDKSPGDLGSFTNPTARTDFPTTVPCVSDASMTTYMEYLYMQQPIDGIYHNATVTGVPVSIDAVDPSGNFVHIATVTSDGSSGTFGYNWTAPTTPGQYTITATFAGDDSYGSSYATTYATINQPTATATQH